MGRGTRARRWLSTFGYAEPSVTEVRVNVHYATRLFSRAAADLQGDRLAMISPTADIARGAVAFAVEGDRRLVTLFDYGGRTPPTELSEFRAFARTLVVDDLCLGDSLCHLNPSYGQGITSAALQAEALDKALAHGRHSLPRRYHKLAVKAASQPFDLSWSSNLDLPSVVAPPNPTPEPIRAYVRRAMRVARHDPAVALALRRIMGLVDPPPALLRPSIFFRVLFGNAEVAGGHNRKEASHEHFDNDARRLGQDREGI